MIDWGDSQAMQSNTDNRGAYATQLTALQNVQHAEVAARARALSGSTVGRAIGAMTAIALVAGGLLWIGTKS